jgi:hypothetical protein
VRDDILRARTDLMQLRTSPLPVDEIKRQITAEVLRKAARGAPLLNIGGPKVSFTWPDISEYAMHPGNGTASDQLCWLFKDAYLTMLTAGLDEDIGDRGIPLTERPAREAKLLADILELERIEEALIEQALDRGLPVRRRSDADPRAILGIGIGQRDVAEPDPPMAVAAE